MKRGFSVPACAIFSLAVEEKVNAFPALYFLPCGKLTEGVRERGK